MLSERKRSVTFENENGGGDTQRGGILAGRRGIPMLNLAEEANNDRTETGADPIETYRNEGERVLDEAVRRAEASRRLDEQAMMNGELRDLYEMQLYEQRKLQETVDDVKKQVSYHNLKKKSFNFTNLFFLVDLRLSFCITG